MDQYSLSRNFWDFAFINPEKIKPTHISIYFFAIEHCNRLGWKEKFGLPTSMVLDAIGIKSYSVYKKCFDDLTDWGFFKIIELSKNQYSSNIIALKEYNKAHIKAHTKALDKALIKHGSKQSESMVQSIDSIDIQDTSIQIYNNTNIPFSDFWNLYDNKKGDKNKCEIKWNKLNCEIQKKIIDTLPYFKNSIKDKQFQPHPLTYLNGERWNDEIVTQTKTVNKTNNSNDRFKRSDFD